MDNLDLKNSQRGMVAFFTFLIIALAFLFSSCGEKKPKFEGSWKPTEEKYRGRLDITKVTTDTYDVKYVDNIDASAGDPSGLSGPYTYKVENKSLVKKTGEVEMKYSPEGKLYVSGYLGGIFFSRIN